MGLISDTCAIIDMDYDRLLQAVSFGDHDTISLLLASCGLVPRSNDDMHCFCTSLSLDMCGETYKGSRGELQAFLEEASSGAYSLLRRLDCDERSNLPPDLLTDSAYVPFHCSAEDRQDDGLYSDFDEKSSPPCDDEFECSDQDGR